MSAPATVTLAQSWKERLHELRTMCRESGERLDAELREGYRREHEGQWWQSFCAAAATGCAISEPVWKSAERLGANRMPGYVQRLRVSNALQAR